TTDQKFYSASQRTWVQAYQLTIGEFLLAEDNNRVWLSDIELVQEPMRMYAITVKHNNTFVVGRHKVLAHNMAIACDSMALICSAAAGAAGLILEVAEGALILSAPISGPAGVVAAAGIGYIAGSLIADAIHDGKQRADYQTNYRPEQIDKSIASMKQEVAAQTQHKQQAAHDTTALHCTAPTINGHEGEKIEYGCGYGQNMPKEIPIPGPCVTTGIGDSLEEHPDKKFDPSPKADDLLKGWGCGTGAGEVVIEARPCGFASRGWAGILKDILKGLPKVDDKSQEPCEECIESEEDADKPVEDSESGDELLPETEDQSEAESQAVVSDELIITDESKLTVDSENVVTTIDLAAIDHAESQQSFALDKEQMRTLSEADAELKIILDKIRQHWKQKQKNVCKKHGKRSAGGKHAYKPKELEEVILSPEEIEKLVKVFDGTLSVPIEIGEGVHIWIDYEHIFNPVLKIGCKDNTITPVGLHHDYLGELQKSGLIESVIIKQGEHGIYQIEWSYVGSDTKESTMFPDYWTREQVIQKIDEALRAVIEKEQNTRNVGRWEIKGQTSEGISIIAIIDIYKTQSGQKVGKIVTAYPEIEKTV
ncbi:MAG TPA: EndoU domain-containing protein, partial [Candidatus Babeliales bacterium]|nr:EndoU domain-containing protein [Candidatus Babeliales bacterium]